MRVSEQCGSKAVEFRDPRGAGTGCEKQRKMIYEFKYSRSALLKAGGAEEERERALEGGKVAGSLGRTVINPHECKPNMGLE